MSTVTPNRGYLYPQISDRPQDTAGYLATLAKQVDADVTVIDALLARERDFPMAVISTKVAQTLSTVTTSLNHVLRFDTVEEDNFGMVDLSRDARSILVPDNRPGFYLVGGYALAASPGGSAAAILLDVGGVTGGWGTDVGSAAPEPVHVETVMRFQTPTFTDDPIFLEVFWTGTGVATSLTVNSARMFAFWVRDIT